MKYVIRFIWKLTAWKREYHWEPDGTPNCVEVRDYWFVGTPFAVVLRSRTSNTNK